MQPTPELAAARVHNRAVMFEIGFVIQNVRIPAAIIENYFG